MMPAYIDAVAASIREHWHTHERSHLLFSFHGVPRRYLLAGDPYHCQCLKTARLVAERLGLDAGAVERQLSIAGRARGMAAAVHGRNAAAQLAREGPKRVTSSARASPLTAWKRWRKSRSATARFSRRRRRALRLHSRAECRRGARALLADLIARHVRGWPADARAGELDDRGSAHCAREPRASAASVLSAPLGRFLEISIHTPVIRESLEFYESLGFVQAAVGETWPHPYAVVTDGTVHRPARPRHAVAVADVRAAASCSSASASSKERGVTSRKSASATTCSTRRSCAIRAD